MTVPVEIPKGSEVEEALASVEDSGIVNLDSSDMPTEVTAEIIAGREDIPLRGTGVVEELGTVGCGGKIPVVEDITVLSVGLLAKLVPNILVVETPRDSENVRVLPEVRDGVEFPSD